MFFTIMLPLVAPILVVVGLLTFIGTIGEFVIASVILTDPNKQTVAIGLFQLVSGFQSQNWGIFSAGAVLAALPVMVIFLFSQRLHRRRPDLGQRQVDGCRLRRHPFDTTEEQSKGSAMASGRATTSNLRRRCRLRP